MKVIAEGNKNYDYSQGRFTGNVQLEMLIEAGVPTDPDIARVHSECGAVTKWHSHPGGQVLVLVSGVGRAGAGDEVHGNLPVGTVIETPVDEMHWHGAEDGQDATWLAMTWGVTDWTDDNPLENASE